MGVQFAEADRSGHGQGDRADVVDDPGVPEHAEQVRCGYQATEQKACRGCYERMENGGEGGAALESGLEVRAAVMSCPVFLCAVWRYFWQQEARACVGRGKVQKNSLDVIPHMCAVGHRFAAASVVFDGSGPRELLSDLQKPLPFLKTKRCHQKHPGRQTRECANWRG
jgi:hypothetical protein